MKNQSIRLSKTENDSREEFAAHVLEGLSGEKKSLPCRYIYDDRGSVLFSRIMDLPEYYLTGAEKNILTTQGKEIADCIGENFNLIELGAGDGQKTRLLIGELQKNTRSFRYLPIDISEEALYRCTALMERECREIDILGLRADYFEGLRWISEMEKQKSVILFLGSNIGNFSRDEGLAFLKKLKNSLKKGDLLFIGFDLKKNVDVMLRAYNDAQGITGEFNLNLLHRINRELEGNFDVDTFRYSSTWNNRENAIVSSLISQKEQSVHIGHLERTFHFHAWEAIHTESSYKYTPEDIFHMAEESGFSVSRTFFDEMEYFADSLWEVC